MQVTINGRRREVDPASTLEAVVAELTSAPSGVAVAVNDAVVPRAQWATTPVADGDRVDVLTAVQGG